MVTDDAVRSALGGVLDPHMNVSVVDMGMIRDIGIPEAGDIVIGLAFPCVGCPAWTMIQEDIRERVEAVSGGRGVRIEIRWDEPWQKTDLAPSARERIRTFGYQIFPMT